MDNASIVASAAAAHDAARVVDKVAVTGWSWTTIGVAMLNVLVGGALVTWLKTRAANRKIDIDADEKLRSEMWRDIEALKLSKEQTSRRLTAAEAQIASQTIQLGQQRFILTLVIDELERVQPGNIVARQARVLLHELQPVVMPSPHEVAPMTETIATLGEKC